MGQVWLYLHLFIISRLFSRTDRLHNQCGMDSGILFGDFANKLPSQGSLTALIIILPNPCSAYQFPSHTIHILYIWLAGIAPGEITWFCTQDLLEVGGETILFHLIISYLWVCSFLNINGTYYLPSCCDSFINTFVTAFPSR